MNAFLFFIIIGIVGMLIITQAGKKSKWVDKHYLKLLWGFWTVWMITMSVSVELIEDENTVQNKKLIKSKEICYGTFQICNKERNGLNALLEIGDEEFCQFETADGKQYQIYLFKKKGKYLYEFIE